MICVAFMAEIRMCQCFITTKDGQQLSRFFLRKFRHGRLIADHISITHCRCRWVSIIAAVVFNEFFCTVEVHWLRNFHHRNLVVEKSTAVWDPSLLFFRSAPREMVSTRKIRKIFQIWFEKHGKHETNMRGRCCFNMTTVKTADSHAAVSIRKATKNQMPKSVEQNPQ